MTTIALAGVGLASGAVVAPAVTGSILESAAHEDAAVAGSRALLDAVDGGVQAFALPLPSTGQLLQVRNPSGQIVASTNAAVAVSDDGDEIRLLTGREPPDRRWVTSSFDPSRLPEPWLVTEVTRRFADGTWSAYVATPPTAVRESVKAVQAVMAALVPLLLAGIAGLVWWSLGRLLEPVERVRAQAFAAANTASPAALDIPASGVEIATLVATFNDLLGRLQMSLERQQRLVADASHELLTPLAGIRTQLEVALRGRQTDWPTVARRCLAVEHRLADVAQNLLALARASSSGGHRNHTTEFDLVTVIREELAVVPVPVEADLPPHLVVRGDRTGLWQVVHNVVANAARHHDRRIVLRLAADEHHVTLTVEDDGPGVPESDRHRIFEPFVRLDQSRTRADGGAGLGLAIVGAIVAEHDGSVAATSSPLGGARLVVQLPRASSSEE